MLKCTVHRGDAAIVLDVRGELDLATAPQFHRHLLDAAEGGEHVIVDMSALEFIDASGLHALHRGQRSCQHEGRNLVVVAPTYPACHRVVEMAGREWRLMIVPTRDAAVALLGQASHVA